MTSQEYYQKYRTNIHLWALVCLFDGFAMQVGIALYTAAKDYQDGWDLRVTIPLTILQLIALCSSILISAFYLCYAFFQYRLKQEIQRLSDNIFDF